MKTMFLGIALILTTLGVGFWHGQLSARWGPQPNVTEAAQLLGDLPTSFGQWKMVKEEQLAKEVADVLHCYGSVQRVYQHDSTGTKVSFVVLFGPMGPISVHTPEICYSSRDYSVATQREALVVQATPEVNDQLWDLRLKANRATGQPLRVLYAWTCNGVWQATERPRFSFAGKPYLYKLQLALATPANQQQNDLCENFLQEFLPVLRPLLLKS